jgi:predicted nuclease of predicted toxin-antitoxin system
VKILLDENFPLQLYRKLREAGYDAEHIIVLGKRGMPDAELRQRLTQETLVFLTNDTEFEDLAAECRAQVIISRLPQRVAIAQRVDVWLKALQEFLERKPTQKLFDLLPDGRIVAWEIQEGRDRLRHDPDKGSKAQ